MTLALRETLLYSLNHAAHRVDPIEVSKRAGFHFVGQSLDEIRATQRIHSIRDARFPGNDLLSSQCYQRGSVSRQCERFIVSISVQRLGTAEHTSESLNRHAHDVVQRLLYGEGNSGGLRVEP